MMTDRSETPPAVNFHLWKPCNMRCRFCFATFEDVARDYGHLVADDAERIASLLGDRFDKVSFAGGEPTLCPWLPRVVSAAKTAGASTMVVTNGSRLSPGYIQAMAGCLDWVALSIDSPHADTLRATGRVTGRGAMSSERVVAIARDLRNAGVRVKVNTVVTSINQAEDLSDLIRAVAPERWKILQVLPVDGQNDGKVEPLLVGAGAFRQFVSRHQQLSDEGVTLVPEDNNAMTGSYAMVGPAGRFFDNVDGHHTYSRPILDVGVDDAWNDIRFDLADFEARGGRYDWGSR
jgi:radical S-adenosyl methionine domain-containing protein 2